VYVNPRRSNQSFALMQNGQSDLETMRILSIYLPCPLYFLYDLRLLLFIDDVLIIE
jgi:hypothetical protein